MYDFGWFLTSHARREPPMASHATDREHRRLARLDYSAEIPVYQDSLSRILDFVSALDRAHTTDVARCRIRFRACRSVCAT